MNHPQLLHPPTEKALSRLSRTTGQEILFLLAIAFVAGFGWWWYQAWSTLMSPPSLLSPQGIFTTMISAVYALVVPLFISMLLPNSPAGWLLQQQTWAYPGQLAVLIATIVLGAFGGNAMRIWLLSQGATLIESGMFYPAFAAALVGAFLVPGLQFAYMTPTQQLVRIQQAHEIRKLKVLHGAEVAILQARMQWLAIQATKNISEILPEDREEITRSLGGLLKGIVDSQRRIASTVGVSRDVQAAMGLVEDDEIDHALTRVQGALSYIADEAQATIPEAPTPEHVFADEAHDAHVNSRLQSRIPRSTPRETKTPQSARQRQVAPESVDDETIKHFRPEIRAMYDKHVQQPFTAKEMAVTLKIGESTAREMKNEWLELGIIKETNLGRWCLTDRAVTEASYAIA